MKTCPFLSLTFEFHSCSLKFAVDNNDILQYLLPVKCTSIRWIGVGKFPNLAQSPEYRIPCPTSFAVLVRDANHTKTLLVNAKIRDAGVKEVENITELHISAAY